MRFTLYSFFQVVCFNMAHYQSPIVLVFFCLILAIIQPSDGIFIKGSVTCLDCDDHIHSAAGIKVTVKCSKVKKLGMATTAEDGSFETELPNSSSSSFSPQNCCAKILGGPKLLYTKSNNIGTKVVQIQGQDFYTISEPLNFYKFCPATAAKCASILSSKTVDLPLPREWGFPPTSYYSPFIPIIGIP